MNHEWLALPSKFHISYFCQLYCSCIIIPLTETKLSIFAAVLFLAGLHNITILVTQWIFLWPSNWLCTWTIQYFSSQLRCNVLFENFQGSMPKLCGLGATGPLLSFILIMIQYNHSYYVISWSWFSTIIHTRLYPDHDSVQSFILGYILIMIQYNHSY